MPELILLITLSTCSSQLRFSSIIRPRNFVFGLGVKLVSGYTKCVYEIKVWNALEKELVWERWHGHSYLLGMWRVPFEIVRHN